MLTSLIYLLTVINSRRYEVKGHLGEGGFGTVYAATRLDDGLQVSIRFIYNIYLANHFCPVILLSQAVLVYLIFTI